MRSPARQSTTINPRNRRPWTASPAARMTAMISWTVGGVSGIADPLIARRPAGVKLRQRDG
jgi:hypothetical protein